MLCSCWYGCCCCSERFSFCLHKHEVICWIDYHIVNNYEYIIGLLTYVSWEMAVSAVYTCVCVCVCEGVPYPGSTWFYRSQHNYVVGPVGVIVAVCLNVQVRFWEGPWLLRPLQHLEEEKKICLVEVWMLVIQEITESFCWVSDEEDGRRVDY